MPAWSGLARRYGSVEAAARACEEHLAESYSAEAVEAALGVKLTDLFAGQPGALRSLAVAAADGASFPLRTRAVHVYSEAKRVTDFRHVCEVSE